MSLVSLRCVEVLIFYFYVVGNNSLYPSMEYYLPLWQRVSGNMKYPVFRFLWCTDFLWLISSKALPKVFPHVTHWLCFEKA